MFEYYFFFFNVSVLVSAISSGTLLHSTFVYAWLEPCS